MIGLLSKCCCPTANCRGIQLWCRAYHLGFTMPAVSELIQSGKYGNGGGSTSTQRTNFSEGIGFMHNDTLPSLITTHRTDGFFPPNPSTYYSNRQGPDIFSSLSVSGTLTTGGGTGVYNYALAMTIDTQTGYCKSLSASWDSDVFGVTDSGSYSYAISFEDGTITTSGDSIAILTAATLLTDAMNRFRTFIYTSGDDYSEWTFEPVFGGVGSGTYHNYHPSLGVDDEISWSGSNSITDFAAAQNEIDDLIGQDLDNHTTYAVETWNSSGEYLGNRMQWNHYYRGLTTIELYVKIYGESFPTGSYTGDLVLWPQRYVLLDGEFLLTESATNGLGDTIINTPGTYGKFYYGMFADLMQDGDWNYTDAWLLGFKCKVEIQGDNRIFQANQDATTWPLHVWVALYYWFGSTAWAAGTEISDCTSSTSNHVVPGTYVFRPDDLIYDFGIGVIQSRTYWDGTECTTIEDTPWAGQRNPCYR